ncbi:MAG: succinylglutamate desuccinylase/aspartoacylase family protein [Kofleriaceae bacterium]|nr:succinylglutamate desuccinylase/aspartoacylase family protein [Kofleriaceae bacterium]MBP6838616.1 succinylglutamate desuccinylase/aspartoacylase family protein [Kofleriaceae bacterium]
MGEPRERGALVLGHTVLGRPIEAVFFPAASYARPRPPAVLFGAIHGDEPATVLVLERLAEELIEHPPGRDTWIVPCLNVDGVMAGSKNNARDVDLNRSFAAGNWTSEHKGGYSPGPSPESEPEVQALVRLIDDSRAERLIAVHATFRCFNWDGRGRALAEEMAARAEGYPATGDLGYPTPGSFGSKYGVDRGLEVVTIEVPQLAVDEQAWLDTRRALRWAVDLPD